MGGIGGRKVLEASWEGEQRGGISVIEEELEEEEEETEVAREKRRRKRKGEGGGEKRDGPPKSFAIDRQTEESGKRQMEQEKEKEEG